MHSPMDIDELCEFIIENGLQLGFVTAIHNNNRGYGMMPDMLRYVEKNGESFFEVYSSNVLVKGEKPLADTRNGKMLLRTAKTGKWLPGLIIFNGEYCRVVVYAENVRPVSNPDEYDPYLFPVEEMIKIALRDLRITSADEAVKFVNEGSEIANRNY